MTSKELSLLLRSIPQPTGKPPCLCFCCRMMWLYGDQLEALNG